MVATVVMVVVVVVFVAGGVCEGWCCVKGGVY